MVCLRINKRQVNIYLQPSYSRFAFPGPLAKLCTSNGVHDAYYPQHINTQKQDLTTEFITGSKYKFAQSATPTAVSFCVFTTEVHNT